MAGRYVLSGVPTMYTQLPWRNPRRIKLVEMVDLMKEVLGEDRFRETTRCCLADSVLLDVVLQEPRALYLTMDVTERKADGGEVVVPTCQNVDINGFRLQLVYRGFETSRFPVELAFGVDSSGRAGLGSFELYSRVNFSYGASEGLCLSVACDEPGMRGLRRRVLISFETAETYGSVVSDDELSRKFDGVTTAIDGDRDFF